MTAPPQVIVVGAGIVGASVAWHLVRLGAAVTIVAPDVGGIATRDSFAWLNATWHNPRSYYDFRRQSMAAWKRLVQEVPALDGVVQWCGSLQWDMPSDELLKFEKEHSAWGYDIHRIKQGEIHALEPWLSQDTLPDWALRIDEEGAVEAAAAASLLVADAQARGAQLLSTTVSGVLQENACVKGVVLASGEQRLADHVVLAAGIGSKQLCSLVGIELPIASSTGLLVHSNPVSRRLLHRLILAPGLHIRQTAEGRLVAGAGFAGSTPGEEPEKTATELFAKVKSMFSLGPTERDILQQDFFTVGMRVVPTDGLPILGATKVKGLKLAVMHSGVTLAAAVGELLAEDIVNGKADMAFTTFGLGRFDR